MATGTAQQNEPILGILEWFRPGEHARVERALDALDKLKIRYLRTGISWADWMTPEGRPWYEWLLPTLASRVDVLPCFNYTPPSLNDHNATNAPPRRLEEFGDFVCYCIELFGDHFDWVEVWN
ncbi:MAG: NAD-dependent dehydratase, partial [Planctomycetota bacterium]